jgi:hypothetical protein
VTWSTRHRRFGEDLRGKEGEEDRGALQLDIKSYRLEESDISFNRSEGRVGLPLAALSPVPIIGAASRHV